MVLIKRSLSLDHDAVATHAPFHTKACHTKRYTEDCYFPISVKINWTLGNYLSNMTALIEVIVVMDLI